MELRELIRQMKGDKSECALAAELGLPQATLNRILNGKSRIGPAVAAKLVKAHPEMAAAVSLHFGFVMSAGSTTFQGD